MQPKILNINDYHKYFSFQEPETGCRILQEPKSGEHYLNFQVFLPKTFFNINPLGFFMKLFFNESSIPENVHLNFELFGMGELGNEEAFIFKPWIINIDNPMILRSMENFHLFIPATIFHNLIERLIFFEQLNLQNFPHIRVLQDIPINSFERFGLDRDFVTNEIRTKNLTLKRIFEPNSSEIKQFYDKHWERISGNLEHKYFQRRLNTWYEVSKKGLLGNNRIGYVRLYNTNSSFTGGISIEYIIHKKEQGKGYATEAAEAIINLIKEKSYAFSVEGEVNDDNLASIKVLEKLGFQRAKSNFFQKDNFLLSLTNKLDKINSDF